MFTKRQSKATSFIRRATQFAPMETTKCNNCDKRGYITEHHIPRSSTSRSCPCGWAIAQQAKRFEGWSLGDLIRFKNDRLVQKGKATREEVDEMEQSIGIKRNG